MRACADSRRCPILLRAWASVMCAVVAKTASEDAACSSAASSRRATASVGSPRFSSSLARVTIARRLAYPWCDLPPAAISVSSWFRCDSQLSRSPYRKASPCDCLKG